MGVLKGLKAVHGHECNGCVKGSERIISSEPPSKDAIARLKLYPLKLCLINYELDINVLNSKNGLFSALVALQK